MSPLETGRGQTARCPTHWRPICSFLLLSLILPLVFVCSSWAKETPPNIIVILADDLGYGDVGFNGCPDIPTPNIDSLAANGVLCTNGYVTHPFCSPSRAGLLAGRYQQRFGFENNPEDDATNPLLGLSTNEVLLPKLLKPAGTSAMRLVSGIWETRRICIRSPAGLTDFLVSSEGRPVISTRPSCETRHVSWKASILPMLFRVRQRHSLTVMPRHPSFFI